MLRIRSAAIGKSSTSGSTRQTLVVCFLVTALLALRPTMAESIVPGSNPLESKRLHLLPDDPMTDHTSKLGPLISIDEGEDPDERPASSSPAFSRSRALPDHPSEPEGAQLMAAILATALGVAVIGELTKGGTRGAWEYTAAALAGWAVATGAIVCAIGQSSPTRHGGCRASMVGALVGAFAVLPGWLLLRYGTCNKSGNDQCAFDGLFELTLASGGYVLGTSYGARIGWDLGAAPRSAPSQYSATFTLMSLHF